MITFELTRFFSSAEGTLGTLEIKTPTGEVTLDTIEVRSPDKGKSHKGLCLPVGEYSMSVGRTFLDFEGEAKPYPWFFLDTVKGFPLASIVSYHGEEYIRGARIQYGKRTEDDKLSGGYAAAKRVFELLKGYYNVSEYTFKCPVKLIITESPDMERVEARRRVVREAEEFVLMV